MLNTNQFLNLLPSFSYKSPNFTAEEIESINFYFDKKQYDQVFIQDNIIYSFSENSLETFIKNEFSQAIKHMNIS